MNWNRKRTWAGQRGFSLVELMIVVGIIGILSTMVQSSMMPKVRRALAVAQMQVIARSLIAVREIDGKTLGEISGSHVSFSGCQNANPAGCPRMEAAMIAWGFNGKKQTPWGGYYWVDENNGEFGPGDACRRDAIGAYDNDAKVNIIITIPPLNCAGSTWSDW